MEINIKLNKNDILSLTAHNHPKYLQIVDRYVQEDVYILGESVEELSIDMRVEKEIIPEAIIQSICKSKNIPYGKCSKYIIFTEDALFTKENKDLFITLFNQQFQDIFFEVTNFTRMTVDRRVKQNISFPAKFIYKVQADLIYPVSKEITLEFYNDMLKTFDLYYRNTISRKIKEEFKRAPNSVSNMINILITSLYDKAYVINSQKALIDEKIHIPFVYGLLKTSTKELLANSLNHYLSIKSSDKENLKRFYGTAKNIEKQFLIYVNSNSMYSLATKCLKDNEEQRESLRLKNANAVKLIRETVEELLSQQINLNSNNTKEVTGLNVF